MSWDNHRLDGVWEVNGLRHTIIQWSKEDYDFQWDTRCGLGATPRTSDGGKKPRVIKGFVTCLQCLAREAEP